MGTGMGWALGATIEIEWRPFRAALVSFALGAFILAGPSAAGTAEDADGNGIDDMAELLLAEKFRPVLVLPSEEPVKKPCPVGVLGDGGELTADKLWARVYNTAGQLVSVARTTDPLWDPAPPFSSPSFNYSSFGWDQDAIPYVGSPPGAAYYLYFVRLYADYGGPSVDCPHEWEDLFAEGDGFHAPGGDLPATAYAHLFLDQGTPILQYWFFFPWNDWVNNHEGDWEHLHLRLSSADPGDAEIAGACFYFHGFSLERSPSALVLADETHPVVWMGGYGEWSCGGCDPGDCPGDPNRGHGSHASFPAPGPWLDVGGEIPGCGRADELVERCGAPLHWRDLAVAILPEPDAVDYAERPGLSWHKAKIPFGTPFVPSYCDDACEFFGDFPPTSWLVTACGNAAPRGPSHHPAWSRFSSGAAEGEYHGGAPAPGPPRTIRVPAEAATIREAADCALPGDTILAGPGTYPGGARLPGGVTVLSESGPAFTVWQAHGGSFAALVNEGAVGTRIGGEGQGFTFAGDSRLPALFPIRFLRLASRGENTLCGNLFTGFPPVRCVVEVPPGESATRIESNRFSVPLSPAIRAELAAGQELVVGGSLAAANDFERFPGEAALEIFCDSCPDVAAEYNYWGSLDPDTIRAMLAGFIETVDFDPWTDSAHAGVYGLFSGSPGDEEAEEPFRFDEAEPNPVSGEVTVRFRIPEAGTVRIRLYDAGGREVLRPWEGRLGTGAREITFGVRSLASGIFFVKIDSKGRSAVRKIVLVR
ncbi:MAG: T9SS type A sorting domain-containing protein [Candidatus Eisenbacteria bacterium]